MRLHSLLAAAAIGIAATIVHAVSVAPATAGGGLPPNVVQAEVLPGWETGGGTRMAALRLRLAPGWKTYWRAPGDAGIPPTFDWSGSRNLAGVTLHWPAPDVFHTYGMRTIGYADELILPMELRPERQGEAIRLAAVVDLGICETVCIPAEIAVHANLSGAGAMDPVIRAALAERPVPATSAGVRSVSCDVAPISDGVQLTARIEMPGIGGDEVALVEVGDPNVWVSDPQVARASGTLVVRADLVPPRGVPLALDRSALRFTVIGSRRSVDIRGCN